MSEIFVSCTKVKKILIRIYEIILIWAFRNNFNIPDLQNVKYFDLNEAVC